jgi:PAS domain S-box-containing protein
MSHDEHHEHLMEEVAREFEPVLKNSPQGVYIYLDDTHKICNEKFAEMLGYSSVQDWVDNEFPVEDVKKEDQEKGINAYMNASQKFEASTFEGTWIKKDGTEIKTEVIMVPVTFKGETFVLHFISEK